jgi:hypothetical protein
LITQEINPAALECCAPYFSLPSPTPMPKKNKTSVGARILLSIIGLLLAGGGAAFSYFLWVSYQRAMMTRSWNETPCLIQYSAVEQDQESLNGPIKYRPHVIYTYIVGEESFKNENIRQVPDVKFNDKETAADLVKKYPEGQGAICFVKPQEPNTAVLVHETKAGLYSIWFPLLFVVGGLGMVINIWWPQPEDEDEDHTPIVPAEANPSAAAAAKEEDPDKFAPKGESNVS